MKRLLSNTSRVLDFSSYVFLGSQLPIVVGEEVGKPNKRCYNYVANPEYLGLYYFLLFHGGERKRKGREWCAYHDGYVKLVHVLLNVNES